MADLKNLIALVEAKLTEMDAAIGPHPDWKDHQAYEDWRQSETKAEGEFKEALTAAGASFGSRPAVDFTIWFGGVRATSTSSLTGAVNYWLTAAHKRLPEEL